MLKTLAATHPGWVVDAFWSGEDALEAARKMAYDAAVLDFTLPGITGLEVARELHRRVSDMPMVLVTARGSEKIAAQALRIGVSEYLIKEGEYLELLPLAVSKAIESVEAARDRERMRKDLIRRTEELSALNAVGTVVAASLSVEDVLADALDRTLDVVGAEAGRDLRRRYCPPARRAWRVSGDRHSHAGAYASVGRQPDPARAGCSKTDEL